MTQLSPRQRDCLKLVWEKQATSKEIAIELGISKSTVDGYIAEAVELLGARDRRDAAGMAFGTRTGSGADPTRVASPPASPEQSSGPGGNTGTVLPWRTSQRPRNSLSFAETIKWIALIAIGSLLALTLATIFGNGVAPVVRSVQGSFDRLTH